MEKNYFNKWEFEQAYTYVDVNPHEAKLRYEQYLEKYPKDYAAYVYYASNLTTLGEFDEAEKVLNYVELIASKDGHFANEFSRVKRFETSILAKRLRLLSYQERYEEILQLYYNNFQDAKQLDLYSLVFYCKKKLGKLDLENEDIHSYVFKQIADYQESEFLDHIQKHSANYTENTTEPLARGIFTTKFSVNEVVEEIKKYIPSDKKLCAGFFEDIYIFKYNECGRENNKLANYFKVVCFHNTKDFITMFPICEGKYLPYVDLNYLVHDEENIKVKRMSQVEKFNKRYKIN